MSVVVSQGPLPSTWNPFLPVLSCWVVGTLGHHPPSLATPPCAQDQEGGSGCVWVSVTGWEMVLFMRSHQSTLASSTWPAASAKLSALVEPLLQGRGPGVGVISRLALLRSSLPIPRVWEVWARSPTGRSWL